MSPRSAYEGALTEIRAQFAACDARIAALNIELEQCRGALASLRSTTRMQTESVSPQPSVSSEPPQQATKEPVKPAPRKRQTRAKAAPTPAKTRTRSERPAAATRPTPPVAEPAPKPVPFEAAMKAEPRITITPAGKSPTKPEAKVTPTVDGPALSERTASFFRVKPSTKTRAKAAQKPRTRRRGAAGPHSGSLKTRVWRDVNRVGDAGISMNEFAAKYPKSNPGTIYGYLSSFVADGLIGHDGHFDWNAKFKLRRFLAVAA